MESSSTPQSESRDSPPIAPRVGTVVLRNVSRNPPVPFICQDVTTTTVRQVRVVVSKKTGLRGASIEDRKIPTTIRIPVDGETGHLDPRILATSQVVRGFRLMLLRGRLILGPGERVEQYGDVLGDLVSRKLVEVVGRTERSDKKTKVVEEREAAKKQSLERIEARRRKNVEAVKRASEKPKKSRRGQTSSKGGS